MRLAELAGRRVAILGYGQEGRAAERVLVAHGVPPAAVFTGDAEAPDSERHHPGLPDAGVLASFDVVIRSPGISPYREPLASLPPGRPRVITGTEIWFAEHPGARSVVVTGTKGKSTTAALIAHLVEAAGRSSALGGNIGVPMLEWIDTARKPDIWVIELSSYQIRDLQARPSIAVILNLYPEHLDWHGSEQRYFEDKLSLIRGMGDRAVIVNHADRGLMERLPPGGEYRLYNHEAGIHVRDDRVYDGERALFRLDGFRLAGAHNRSNLCAALAVLREFGLDPSRAGAAVNTFEPLPHRLQSLGVIDGVEYVDDSISTTPWATRAALECYPGRRVTVLVGGHDRGLDWSGFAEFAARRRDLAVVTFGAAAARIAGTIKETSPGLALREAGSLEEAVAEAARLAGEGGVVLLSPGSPSFDAFRDYRERGKAFAELARRPAS